MLRLLRSEYTTKHYGFLVRMLEEGRAAICKDFNYAPKCRKCDYATVCRDITALIQFCQREIMYGKGGDNDSAKTANHAHD